MIYIEERVNQIDLLFIDDDHLYEGCKTDWIDYSALLGKGFIVIFHDMGWENGVLKVINEFVIDIAEKVLELPNMQAFKIRSCN